MAFLGVEFHLALQNDIPDIQDNLIQISIKELDRHTAFRMVSNNLIRELSLKDQRGDDHILLPEFMFCHTDAGTGIMKTFPALPVSELRIITVIICDGSMIDGFWVAVTDIGSIIQTVTAFPYRFNAGLVAGMTGSAFRITEDNLAAYICLTAAITVDT